MWERGVCLLALKKRDVIVLLPFPLPFSFPSCSTQAVPRYLVGTMPLSRPSSTSPRFSAGKRGRHYQLPSPPPPPPPPLTKNPEPLPCSSQLIRFRRRIKNSPSLLILNALILNHTIINTNVIALDGKRGLGDRSLEDEVVVAVRAVLVGLLELLRVLAETLAALLARERHLEGS